MDTAGPKGRPICVCGLIQGVGFLNGAGEVSEADPAPTDSGQWVGTDWYCTAECADVHVQWVESVLQHADGRPVRLKEAPVRIEESPSADGKTTMVQAWAGLRRVYLGEYTNGRGRSVAIHHAKDRLWAEVMQVYPGLCGDPG